MRVGECLLEIALRSSPPYQPIYPIPNTEIDSGGLKGGGSVCVEGGSGMDIPEQRTGAVTQLVGKNLPAPD